MLRRLIILLLIVGCEEPEEICLYDCEGTCNGDAREDNCGVCDSKPSNDCVQDCKGIWGGSAISCEDDLLNSFNYNQSTQKWFS